MVDVLFVFSTNFRPFSSGYGRISQMTYQPKSVDKMADSETLTVCISLDSSQTCTYFCKDLVTGHCPRALSVPGKKFDSQLSSVFRLILFITHNLLL